MIKRLVILALALALSAVAGLAAVIAFPQPLFAHTYRAGTIAFHSDRSIPDAAAAAVGRQIAERLTRSPLGTGTGTYSLFIARDDWRRRLLWNIIAPRTAGGFAAYPVSGKHAFLSGAAFEADRLVAPGGYVPPAPRTLAYYGAHELTHVRTGEVVGAVRYHMMPRWIREGLADYVAMAPREDFAALHAAVAGRPDELALWNAHGYYAHYRLLVQYFLEVEGWPIERLLTSDLSEADARARMASNGTPTKE